MSRIGESWGRFPRVRQRIENASRQGLPRPEGFLLPYGNGRSYGDGCLNPGGTLLRTRNLDRFIAFDPATGVLRCEAGVLLSEILALVVAQDWFLPVTPGTKFVTVGGAIANDVHGKNQPVAGSFGQHLLGFELLRSDGSRRVCRPEDTDGLFQATLGGLGLTGLITWAELRLRRIPGPWLATETLRFERLADFFRLSQESAQGYEYTVAWVDCLAKKASLGRGIFVRGNHTATTPASMPKPSAQNLRVPFTPPFSLVNSLSVGAFNRFYYRRQTPERQHRVVHYEPFFYPLDAIGDWNRIYGPRGFLQYQCVIPPASAADAMAELLAAVAASGSGSFLAVLKEFGDLPSAGMLSFPRAGTTLALDFPNSGAELFGLLNRLDEITASAGGAVYPAKDARWPGERFRRAYPRWQEFSAWVDPQFSSGFWRRAMEPACNVS